jgi:hypothetical protein
VRSWREWFVTPEDEAAVHVTEDDIRSLSGAGHMEEDRLNSLPKAPPRCASCKKFVGYSTGMHLMLSSKWRIHISCFAEVLERHYEDGEVIDLTTGAVHKLDEFID